MILRPITINPIDYPTELHPFLMDAQYYDSSCSPEARVIFIDKDEGYFLKSAPKGRLAKEASMMTYFYTLGLSTQVICYLSDQHDWLLTSRLLGEDCTAKLYQNDPVRLCDTLAERLSLLHDISDYQNCPNQNHTRQYLGSLPSHLHEYQATIDPQKFGYRNVKEAWFQIETDQHLLETNTLLHGDYCLPNIILNDWEFSGFIDVDRSGIGDRHVDIFWGIWTLAFNLKTDQYQERFIDAYGRQKVDHERLRLVAAIEVFK